VSAAIESTISAERPWLAEYPPGMPADIRADLPRSLVEVFEESCGRFAAAPAFSSFGAVMSYADLDRRAAALAAYLQHDLGLQRGERVALMMPNVLQYPVAVFAVLRAGLVVVNVNPLYTPRELAHQLADSGARAIVVLENFASTLQEALPHTRIAHVITTEVGDLMPWPKRVLLNFVARRVKKAIPPWRIEGATDFRAALRSGAGRAVAKAPLAADDIAFLQYTGGTTGVAKGAILTHGNLVSVLEQLGVWIAPHMHERREVVITALPLYHVFGLAANCLTFLRLGAKNVLIANPRDLAGMVAELRKHRFTVLTGVNTMFAALLEAPGFGKLDFSGLKFVVGGGTAVQQAVAERWKAVTGCALSEGYGLTESSGLVSVARLDRPDWNGTIGLPLPSTVVSLRDDEGRAVPPGEPGELCIKGPQMTHGYWRQPEDTARSFTADGFFRTGDVAVMDGRGYLKIVDRKKDMILVSGFNVYPNEIEAALVEHPGVLEAACIGVPDEKTGEAVQCFIVRRDPALTVGQLREHCRARLTGYKQPRHFEFRETLPKSPVGKILRKELRAGAA
jgi:long-chain acyl-CoA synthetase